MGNHIHLLIGTEEYQLDLIFKSFGAIFVPWYNKKYGRTGTLFQGRFFSEPIKNETHLLEAIRYIHNNPVKAGMCKDLHEYRWTSNDAYFSNKQSNINTKLAITIAGGKKELQHFLTTEVKAEEYEYNSLHTTRPTEAVIQLIKENSPLVTPADFQLAPKTERNKWIRELHAKGISQKELSRYAGVSPATINRIINNWK